MVVDIPYFHFFNEAIEDELIAWDVIPVHFINNHHSFFNIINPSFHNKEESNAPALDPLSPVLLILK